MIKKSDAQARLQRTYEAEIEALEKRIDERLVEQELPLRFAVNNCAGPVIKAIMEKYQKEGGYTVRLDHGDQREPCCDLVFS